MAVIKQLPSLEEVNFGSINHALYATVFQAYRG